MELGLTKIRRSKVNTLMGGQAIDKKYGLAWTDGTHVYLSEFMDNKYENSLSQTRSTVTVGEFKNTIGAYWSAEKWHFLAVYCLESLTILRIQGRFPELKVEKVQEIAQKTLTQVCGWHPSNPILCAASHLSVAIFSWDNSRNKFCQVKINFTDTVITTRWSHMGELYILTKDTYLHVYHFDCSQSLKYEKRSYMLPHFEGTVRCLGPLSHHLVVVTTDLPLTDLIAASQQDMFETARPQQGQQTVGRTVAEDPGQQVGPIDLTSMVAEKRSNPKVTPTNRSEETPLDDLVDLTTLKHHAEAASHLLLTPAKMPHIKDSSQLMAIDFSSGEAEIVCRVALPNILQPDLLTCTEDQIIAVGSNTRSNLLLFQFKQHSLQSLSPICLGENERPKGLCCYDDGFLVMVGIKLESHSSSAFLPSSVFESFKMKLQKFPVLPIHHSSTPTNGTTAKTSEKELTHLRLPGGSILGSPTPRPENMATAHSRDFSEKKKEDTNCTSFYPSAKEAAVVHLNYANGGQTTTKTFLLNKDLLHLQTVESTFSLALIELFIDSHPVILSADKDGYIPISFTNGQTFRINGKKLS